MTGVKVGDLAPDFVLYDQNDIRVKLSDYRGKRVILYFYPGDMTMGCMRETRLFEKRKNDFENTVILGISSGSRESKQNMASTCGASFSLLNDHGGAMRSRYGVPKDFIGFAPGRRTYYINEEGKVVKIHGSSINMESHIEEGLNIFGKK